MPDFELFMWDDINEGHVAEHCVTVDEFEYVVLNAKRAGVSRSSGRPSVIGRTQDDRLICCVYEVIEDYCYPVTAYDVE